MGFSSKLRAQATSADVIKRYVFDGLSFDGGKTHPWLECRVAGKANAAFRAAEIKIDDAKAIAAARASESL